MRAAADPTADAELDESIRTQGILLPLLVRQLDGRLEILAGLAATHRVRSVLQQLSAAPT